MSDTDLCEGLESLGVNMTKREGRLLIDSTTAGGEARASASSPTSRAHRRRALNFRQFSRMIADGGSRPRIATTPPPSERGRRHENNDSTSRGRSQARSTSVSLETPTRGVPTIRRRATKGVTFLEEDNSGDDDDEFSYRVPETLRVSLRHLVSADSTGHLAEGVGTGNSVGPGLRDKLRGALQIAADGRGARRGQRHVDLETVRQAMTACGAPLSPKLLSDLGRRLDRRGTGEVNVEVRIVLVCMYIPGC